MANTRSANPSLFNTGVQVAMLILSVPIFLVLAGWVLLLVHRLNKKSGIHWLISTVVSLLSFIGWGVIGGFGTAPVLIDLAQLPFGIPEGISFSMDTISRGVGVVLLAFLVFVLNSWMVKLDEAHIFRRVQHIFLLAAVSLCLISASTLLTWVAVLIVLDFIDLLHLLRQIRVIESPKRYFTSALISLAGTLVFFLGWLLSIHTSAASVLSREILYAGLFIHLWGGFYRLEKQNPSTHSDATFEEALFLLIPLLVFFMRYPIGSVLPIWMQYLLAIGIVMMVFHLVQWLRSTTRSTSIPHFYAFQMLFLLVYIQAGTIPGIVAMVFCFLLSAGVLYFRPIPHSFYLWFAFPLFALLIGLPFLPTSSILTLNDPQYNGIFIFYFLFLLGIWKRYETNQPSLIVFERWMKVLYPIAFVPFLGGLVYLVLMRDIPIQLGAYLLSGGLGLILLILFIYQQLRRKNILAENESLQWIKPVLELLWSRIMIVVNQRWIERFLQFLGGLVKRILDFLNHIMEGDGALLWAIVLLILFLSIVRG